MRRHRVPLEDRLRIGAELREGRYAGRGQRTVLARALSMTVRQMHNWEHGSPGRVGRPPDPPQLVAAATEACRAVLEAQRYGVGWEKVWNLLGGRFSKYRVQECVADHKEAREGERRLLATLARVSVRLCLGEVIWGLDESHLGRLEDGEAVLGLVVREVASTRTLLVSVGPAVTAEDLIRALEHLRALRGELPLVISMDNGPAMKSDLVALYLAFHEVVALRNVPYVSQHNAATERGHRELKEACDLGRGVILHGHAEAARRMAEAVELVNERRLVTTRGMRTPVAVDEEMPRWYHRIDRRAFYQAACRAIREAVQGCRNDRERRKAEREAIFQVLEDFALIERKRGGTPLRDVNRKSIPCQHTWIGALRPILDRDCQKERRECENYQLDCS